MAARIVDVKKGSPAEANGVRPGDELVSVNGEKPRDIIDYELLCSEDDLDLVFRRKEREYTFRVKKRDGRGLGLKFETSLFDGLLRCRNGCIFCFVDQLPSGVRSSLKVKDDDYRLSFLYGNFITLTNLRDSDVERIIDRRLSPLYVSLHTTDLELHRRMVRPKGEDRALERFKALVDGGIGLHVQIVLCPDINDKAELDRTLSDLEDQEGVLSVGIVPVGLTAHRDGLPKLRRFERLEVEELVKKIDAAQQDHIIRRGSHWVYLADEFYSAFDLPLPEAERYDDFPQLENGIGIARRFLDSTGEALRMLGEASACTASRRFIAITGVSSARYAEKAAEMIRKALGVEMSVMAVENTFFGPDVTVTGLVAGKDVQRALGRLSEGEVALVPDVMLNGDGVFVDDLTVEEISKESKAAVEVVPSDGAAFVEWLMRSWG